MPTASQRSGSNTSQAGAHLFPLHHYDRHRTICTCDDKKTAAMISGHAWNIINNSEDHEVYYKNARNPDHYINEHGNNTSHWFEKKKRIDADGDGIIDCLDSSNVEEIMKCPGTAGKNSVHRRQRESNQLCQSVAPRDFATYVGSRSARAPPTPERGGMLERTVPDQHRYRDIHMKDTPRVVARTEYTPRRGDARAERRPPPTPQMFSRIDQLRAESHIDTVDAGFVDAVHSARSYPKAIASLPPPASLGAGGASTARTLFREDDPVKGAAERTRHSRCRMEPRHGREVSSWPFQHQDKLQRNDQYHSKPLQQTGSSCVKYDIISNQRHDFWY